MLAPPTPGGPGTVVVIPGEGRVRERKPMRWFPLQALPIPWTVGGIASGRGDFCLIPCLLSI